MIAKLIPPTIVRVLLLNKYCIQFTLVIDRAAYFRCLQMFGEICSLKVITESMASLDVCPSHVEAVTPKNLVAHLLTLIYTERGFGEGIQNVACIYIAVIMIELLPFLTCLKFGL